MGHPSAFKSLPRQGAPRRPVELRIHDFREVYLPASEGQVRAQGARCMDCGVPFCHDGCPLGNLIPVWNDLVYRGRLRDALEALLSTNNFPEFTGRICPAPCEEACVLALSGQPVTIEMVEKDLAERGFAEGWIQPRPPQGRTGKRVAVVGSGPAGLAVADELNRQGHEVTVFERADRIGGLLIYGIPDFKLDKAVVQRRVDLMEAEGVRFVTGADIGGGLPAAELCRNFHAVCLAIGATQARELPVPGRDLAGIHLAMDYLTQQNRRNLGDAVPEEGLISARGRRVVILGGGDTGADCLGTAHRQGAAAVVQLELMPRPPDARGADAPWPGWPLILRTSAAHEEGGERDFAVRTVGFSGAGGQVQRLEAVRLRYERGADGRMAPAEEIPGSAFSIDCDLVLLALGFVHPEHGGPVAELGLELDPRGNLRTDEDCMTSRPGVFAAGDARRGQSLVVWAIAEGRRAARGISRYLSD